MARNLSPGQRKMIAHMINSKKRLTTSQMAKLAKCTERSITNIRKKMRLFGSPNPPHIPPGPPPIVTPVMLDALCDRLAEIPGLYIDEMAKFLWDEFNILPSSTSIQRALSQAGWTKKTARQRAKEQNPRLRDFYQHKLSEFRSYHLVFVDESGCDKRVGNRWTGWSPLGVTPMQVSKFHRGQRYQILPAYTQDGILLSLSLKVQRMRCCSNPLLSSCSSTAGGGRSQSLCLLWITPPSIIRSESSSFVRMRESGCYICRLTLWISTPLRNFFAELKAYIKKAWPIFERNPDQGFHVFLRRCVHEVGAKQQSAEGHFRHAGITIDKV